MDLFYILFSNLWYQPRQVVQTSPFGTLPPELILSIAEFLPPSSVALLSTTCKFIHSILLTKYAESWKQLTKNGGPGCDEFLNALERDLVQYIACSYCNKLHDIRKFGRYIPSNQYYVGSSAPAAPPCWKANQREMTDFFLHPDFCFTVFKMTMKVYREKQDYTKMLAKLVHSPIRSMRQTDNREAKAWCRIVGGSLFLRTQVVFTIACQTTFQFPEHDGFVICPHSGFVSPRTRGPFGDSFRRCLAYASDSCDQKREDRVLTQCIYCWTEFRIDMKRTKRNVFIIVTRWKDMGEGQSSKDVKWLSHLRSRQRPLRRAEFEAGSIYLAFERQYACSFLNSIVMIK